MTIWQRSLGFLPNLHGFEVLLVKKLKMIPIQVLSVWYISFDRKHTRNDKFKQCPFSYMFSGATLDESGIKSTVSCNGFIIINGLFRNTHNTWLSTLKNESVPRRGSVKRPQKSMNSSKSIYVTAEIKNSEQSGINSSTPFVI